MEGIGFIFAIAWYIVGFWGLLIARRKGHMHWLGGLGIFAFFFYGWVVALILLLIPLALGPIMWAIAKYGMSDRRTPATWAPARPE
jgi:hypothetical protein